MNTIGLSHNLFSYYHNEFAMTLVLGLAQAAAIFSVSWVLWRMLRNYIAKSPLDNIPGPAPTSFLQGNLNVLYHRHKGWNLHEELGEKYDAVVKMQGMFGRRVLYVFDPKAMHSIVIKDQSVYQETPTFLTSNHLMFGPGLVSTTGDLHRKQRKMLNPIFSINHMKHMIPIFYQVTYRLRDAIAAQVKDTTAEVDILNWMGRTALELVGQGGLGYSFNPLVEDIHNPFGDAVKALTPTLYALSIPGLFIQYLVKLGPPSFRRRLLEMVPSTNVQKLREIADTLEKECKYIFNNKKTALEAGDEAVVQQIGEGKDIMSILLKANMEAAESDRLPEEELIGQMSTLVFGAMDTTSNALSRILYLLAEHPDVQEKLRKEVVGARHGQSVPYEELVDLPYLDAVCRETLRLYPPVTAIDRETQEDIVMPLSQPIRGVDGNLIHEIPVPKDIMIIVAIRASNRNKAIWGEDALEWKPDRWMSPLPDSVTKAHVPGVYSNLMTFLGGGRSCIGFKFSQLEVVLSVLLEAFRFSLSDKEIVWNLSLVTYPTIGHDSTRPAMPIKVSLLK